MKPGKVNSHIQMPRFLLARFENEHHSFFYDDVEKRFIGTNRQVVCDTPRRDDRWHHDKDGTAGKALRSGDSMRLFVGLRPSEEFRAALSMLQSQLQSAGVAARYLDPSNLHLTLAFIGEWPENVSAILPPVERPFTLTLSSIGLFPEAKVIWAGVQKSAALDHLAQQVREKLTAAGIPFDPKPFVPHITLGRKPVVPESVNLSGIMIPPAVMTVEDVFLYRSDRGENGMVYSVIGSSSEKGEAAR